MGLEIAIREAGDVTIVDLRGRSTVNDGESEQLGQQLEKLIADGARKLLLNLSGLHQIDSSGVSVIVKTCVELRSLGGDLKLLRAAGHTLTVLSALHLLQVIESYEEEGKAVASFGLKGTVAKGATGLTG